MIYRITYNKFITSHEQVISKMQLYPNDGRSIFRSVASLNFLVHDVKTVEHERSRIIFMYIELILRLFIVRVKYHSGVKVISV